MRRMHPLAGGVAFATILVFWLSTVLSELFGSAQAVAMVKQAIPWGFLLLVPALALAGASGAWLMRGWSHELGTRKQRRMPFIAANGVFVLVPSALYLASLASRGAFDRSFFVVQGIELVAGAVNLVLMGLNMRDGLRLARRG